MDPPANEEDSFDDLSVSYEQVNSEQYSKIKKVKPRAQERLYPGTHHDEYFFAAYLGNFPQVVRDALKLRLNVKGDQVWKEVEPNTNNIGSIDFVWKPVNF